MALNDWIRPINDWPKNTMVTLDGPSPVMDLSTYKGPYSAPGGTDSQVRPYMSGQQQAMDTRLFAGGSQQFAEQNYGVPRATTQQLATNGVAGNQNISATNQITPQYQQQPQQQNISATNQITPQYQQQPQQQGIINNADGYPPVAQASYQTIDPTLRTVQSNELSQQQLYGMLEKDSPLLKLARAKSDETMQSRGLLNSSLATGAAEKAAWEAAQPFALQDAATYAEAANANQLATNVGKEFNASAFNKNQEANVGFVNARGNIVVQEQGEDRRLGVREAGEDRRLDITERGQLDRLNISEAGDTARQNSVNETNRYATDTNAATSRYATDTNAATSRYSTDVNAATSRENTAASIGAQRDIASLQSQTQMYNNQTAIDAAAWNNEGNQIQAINSNPNYNQEVRNRLVGDVLHERTIRESRSTNLAADD